MTDKPLVIIDITAQLFRMYFAKMQRYTPDGVEVGAVWGVCNILQKMFRQMKPYYLAAVFDSAALTFRSEIDPSYKANRGLPPEKLIPQFAIVNELCRKIGISCYQMDGYEADDLMATLAVLARKAGISVQMVSNDKDLNQVIVDQEPSIQRFDINRERLFDEAGVFESMGVQASQCVDYMALVGDSVDNIPGVKGVGAKTAARLLAHYGTLKDLYQNLDEVATLSIRGAASTAKKLKEGKEVAFHCRKLVQLKTDIDLLDVNFPESLRWRGPRLAGAYYLREIGLGRYFDRFKAP